MYLPEPTAPVPVPAPTARHANVYSTGLPFNGIPRPHVSTEWLRVAKGHGLGRIGLGSVVSTVPAALRLRCPGLTADSKHRRRCQQGNSSHTPFPTIPHPHHSSVAPHQAAPPISRVMHRGMG